MTSALDYCALPFETSGNQSLLSAYCTTLYVLSVKYSIVHPV